MVMAYSGFLIKVGDFTIANSMIQADTYIAYKAVQDLDSYSDANGLLHRTALEHIPYKCEFNTKPMLTNTQFASFMNSIKAQYTNALERKALCTVYIPEDDEYITQDMYMAQPEPQIYGTYGGVIHYDAVRLAFIGY